MDVEPVQTNACKVFRQNNGIMYRQMIAEVVATADTSFMK